MISTRDLSLLPDIDSLKRLTQSLATLDAIIMPDWESRYYSFDSRWGENEQMASMRNGSGDDYFVLFCPAGAILKGFAHESVMSPYGTEGQRIWPGVLDEVPQVFSGFLEEPAFTIEETTFCIWRTYSDTAWQRGKINFPDGPDPDGSEDLLQTLDGEPGTYKAWAEEYYERPVNLDAVTHIYTHRPLTPEIVTALNPHITLDELVTDMDQIGYPVA